MEIKILVPENKEKDLDNFIKTCESKGFELQNRGGGTMPSFSGYYATLKGNHWKEIPDPTTQLKADKAELLEGLEKIFKVGYKPYRNTRNEELEIIDTARNLLSKFQKHKQ